MAISTIKLVNVLDVLAAKGVPDPRNLPSGYGDDLAIQIGNEVLADLISERFNWKWNRAVATPFLTNSWQQDYPQLAQPGGKIAWGDDCDILDVNNTAIPKPLNWDGAITWRKQLTRTSVTRWRPSQICWFYNYELSYGTWPGANVTYYPLLTTGAVSQNPIMNFIDKNGNRLILTTFGTTGSVAPFAALNAPEGTTVNDNTCVWTVVDGTSQGFRLDFLPNATGPVYQIGPYYQLEPPRFATLQDLISPIPDSYSQDFFRGYESGMYIASPKAEDRARGQNAKIEWLNAMQKAIEQGNREPDAYALVPQSSPVESRWGWRGPWTADQPY